MDINKVLPKIANKLNLLAIPWRLFASGALMVWGVDIVPQFNDRGTVYLEFQMKIDGVVIEICELNDLGNIVLVDYNGEKIPVAPLTEIRDEYLAHSHFQDRLPLIQKRLEKLGYN